MTVKAEKNGAASEGEAIERLSSVLDLNSTERRADLIAKIVGPLVDQYEQLSLQMLLNRAKDKDPMLVGDFPGVVLDEDEGEAKKKVQDVMPTKEAPNPTLVEKRCKSYGQRLREIEEGIAEAKGSIPPKVWARAEAKIEERKEVEAAPAQ